MKKNILLLMVFISVVSLHAQQNRYSNMISEEDYDYFWAIVTDYFNEEGLTITENKTEGLISLGEPSSDAEKEHPLRYFADSQFSMDNMLMQCLQNEKSMWPEIVSGYFMQTIKTVEFEQEVGDKLDSYAFAEEYLKLRLYPYGYEEYLAEIIHREEIPEIYSVAVFDFPASVRMVRTEYLEKWNMTADQVMETALRNSLDDLEVVTQEFEITPGAVITGFFSDSIFTTTDVYRLDEREELIGRCGTIVSIPTRDVYIAYPVNSNEDASAAAVQLMFMTQGMYADGPGSVSPLLYWYYEGKFEIIAHDSLQGMILFPERYRNLFTDEITAASGTDEVTAASE